MSGSPSPRTWSRTSNAWLSAICRAAELFSAAGHDGSVLDGHGDLMAEDIFCLSDGPRILDCLEFDDRLRHVDQVDDAAFLAMDLEHLGAPRLAGKFLTWYAEFSGDNAPVTLVEHYVAYRAFVRCKVACVRHAQGDPAAAAEARRFASAAWHICSRVRSSWSSSAVAPGSASRRSPPGWPTDWA